jgi:Mannosyl-glycoprotein endo-beta-N-acetylglucosaminidase
MAAVGLLVVLVGPTAQAASLIDVGPAGVSIPRKVGTNTPSQPALSLVPTQPQPTAAPEATPASWVQVVDDSTMLFPSDSASDVNNGQPLARYTFLHVLNATPSSLHVDVYDQYGHVTTSGWVNARQVLASASGTHWLVAAQATPLWRSADPNADALRQLDRFTALQQLDGPVQGRLQVVVYRSDFTMALDRGWVDVAATGPALTPVVRIPPPGQIVLAPAATRQQQAFLEVASQAARDSEAQTGVPASVSVAQAILESDWGRSHLATDANNYFGIKAMDPASLAGNVVWMPTAEYDTAGRLYQTVSAFRAYASMTDSITDHDRLLATAPRYAQAMHAASNPRQFVQLLGRSGYSTDPAYGDKLIALMDRYNLYQLDGLGNTSIQAPVPAITVRPTTPTDQVAAAAPGASPVSVGGLAALNFSPGQATAPTWPNDPGSTAWLGSDGYHLFARVFQRFVGVGVASQPMGNVSIAATFHKTGGPAGGGYGIIVRDQTPDSRDGVDQAGQYYVLEVGDKGEVGIWRREQDHWVDLVPWAASAAVHTGDAENELVVTARNDQLTLSVNGVQVAKATDPTLATGGVGVFLGGDQNQGVLTHLSVQAAD